MYKLNTSSKFSEAKINDELKAIDNKFKAKDNKSKAEFNNEANSDI
ncbi:14608_t:CDS:1, partial [Racocetra fulgida]